MSVVTLDASEDSWVDEANPDTNNVADPGLNFGDFNGMGYLRTWIKFDLSSIAYATINSAVFYIIVVGQEPYQTSTLRRCTDNSWTEAGITWNNAPDASLVTATFSDALTNASGFVFGFAPWYYNFDITSDVSAALASGALSLRWDGDTMIGGIYCRMGGHRYTQSPIYPYLVIDYTPGEPPVSVGGQDDCLIMIGY